LELSRTFRIKNRLGLHARAAAAFVQTANRFSANVKVLKDGYEVNGKSILGVLSLAAAWGTDIEVITHGEDAEEALNLLGELIESGFGEGV